MAEKIAGIAAYAMEFRQLAGRASSARILLITPAAQAQSDTAGDDHLQ